MYITAYTAIADPLLAKLPIYECIESIYDQVQEIVVLDCSKYDRVDLSKYGKVTKHIHSIFNCLDNPFGSMFTSALRLVESDHCMFIDADELYSFNGPSLIDIAKRYPLEQFAGIAFRLINYYCDTHFILDGCMSKGSTLFRMRSDLVHDLLQGFWKPLNSIRRITTGFDQTDGVRLCNLEGQPMGHFNYIPFEEVEVHHTSHIDPVGKQVRSITQNCHTTVMDIAEFVPYDMRVAPEIIQKIYELGEEDIKNKEVLLYGEPIPFDYKYNELLERFIKRANITLFNPTEMKSYGKYKNKTM